ncbi:DUF1128 family protein [Virgibacillus sp. 179-BFC.A HS]|uniref:DUF1128 family protein n=1 Tax=Tigheibacillus jepli TaxID=3035914 RepID=A0ABU5CJ83_9BACI|nr:DUF1128 family protein [Virgibacillus sp. 179-BFC.A HS]MDY0405912.1 DUF1128 family protein [Virgibacillus sp. 179-BFC.A HS]
MNLEVATKENLQYMLEKLAIKLQVINRSIMDVNDYDLDKYDDLKFMYDIVMQKGTLSASESQAFLDELRSVRKG